MIFVLSKLIKIKKPASEQQINEVEQSLGKIFPELYKDFLCSTNGGEVGNGIYFYSTEDILERNRTFEVNEYLPNYILIGDDSGGRGIFMMASKVSTSVKMVGLGSLSEEDFTDVSPNLKEWIESDLTLS